MRRNGLTIAVTTVWHVTAIVLALTEVRPGSAPTILVVNAFGLFLNGLRTRRFVRQLARVRQLDALVAGDRGPDAIERFRLAVVAVNDVGIRWAGIIAFVALILSLVALL